MGEFATTATHLLEISAYAFLVVEVLYIALLIVKRDRLGALATKLAWGGFAVHTGALLTRWIGAGYTSFAPTTHDWAWVVYILKHPPYSNLYESLIFFAWGIVLVYLLMERKFQSRLGGAFVFPFVLAAMGLAALTPDKTLPSLVPALQSGWMVIHVMFASIAYAAFMVAFVFNLMFLIKDRAPMGAFGIGVVLIALTSILLLDNASIVLAGTVKAEKVIVHEGIAYPVSSVYKDVPFDPYVALPGVGLLFFVTFLAYATAGGGYAWSFIRKRRAARLGAFPAAGLAFGFILNTIALGLLVYQLSTNEDLALAGIPFRLTLLGVTWALVGGFLILHAKRESIIDRLPKKQMLDEMGYKAVIVGFPLMFMVLLTGSIWANNAWGSYWSWDPKETWALIVWLVYAAYLHARIARGWTGRRPAVISIIGFAVTIFCYLGVNVFLSGLHSYGAPS